MKKMKMPLAFILMGFVFALISCGGNNDSSSQSGIAQVAKVAGMTVSNKIAISGAGIGGDGSAVWVTCSGHTPSSYVAVNGKRCNTIYYKDHLTCDMPKELMGDVKGLRVEVVNENDNEKSPVFTLKKAKPQIKVLSHGYGGEGNAIWVTCQNHTPETKIYIGNTALHTIFYNDHITASIPENLVANKPHKVFLKDVKSGNKTKEFVVGKVK